MRAGQSLGPLAAGVAVATTSTTTTFVLGAGLALALLAVQLATGQPDETGLAAATS